MKYRSGEGQVFLISIVHDIFAFQQQQQQQQQQQKPSSAIGQNVQLEQTLPKGYYAFGKAALNARPPKVRKPPYLPISGECPGIQDASSLLSKHNMCGDLNRGLIPRNPMGQYVHGEPYPFELIKNKTLQYLSKTLPYLKEEIDNVPKVARFVKPSEFFENHSKRHTRQANLQELNINIENSTNASQMSFMESKMNTNSNNMTKQNRQNGCDGNVICQAIESLKEEGPFSKSFLSNVVSAVGNVASINSVVSLIDQYGQSVNQTNPSSSSQRFALSQLLSSIGSESSSSSNNNNNNNNNNNAGTGSSYSPLLSIIDYLQSLQTPKFATKRKTSPDVEDIIPDGNEKPQTPCMSTEEYISPTYARNYQGVWKYVVQIPNEGKNKCDLIEGSCRESPRWVSLLVAEIFYPDIYFPVNQIMPMLYKQQQQMIQQQGSTTYNKPLNQNAQQQQQQQQQTLNNNGKRTSFQSGSNPIISTASSINLNQLNGLDMNALTNLLTKRINNDPSLLINHLGSTNNNHNNNIHSLNNNHLHQFGLQNLELLARKARLQQDINGNELNNVEDNVSDSIENSSSSNNNDKSKHCDGYDKIGCYVVRVYYDWFLVNGSCKCWKSTSGSSINETIKRIFIGKWKKK
ncbi:hypothetical protein DERP_012079 [Dermatophagoides pteronyssinus]|uniref:Uncharacterized protein n=1 Tax=Dermatophagoides pteronyssinus TaxID=6956 RepID=A0ABQ8ITW3_DERPT|nr:hypothetical protein DERP_012079 [Dermatophagoides pteronyssinus]